MPTQPVPYSATTSNAKMGQVSKGRLAALQVGGWDGNWMVIKVKISQVNRKKQKIKIKTKTKTQTLKTLIVNFSKYKGDP